MEKPRGTDRVRGAFASTLHCGRMNEPMPPERSEFPTRKCSGAEFVQESERAAASQFWNC